MSYVIVDELELATHAPRVVHVDAANCIVDVGHDPAEPVPGSTNQTSSR
jgi:aspartate 1-decarboxylase